MAYSEEQTVPLGQQMQKFLAFLSISFKSRVVLSRRGTLNSLPWAVGCGMTAPIYST